MSVDWIKHVRNERLTREQRGLAGKDLPDNVCVAWCGVDVSGQFFLLGADHALFTILAEDRLVPCKRCLREMRKVIDRGLAESP